MTESPLGRAVRLLAQTQRMVADALEAVAIDLDLAARDRDRVPEGAEAGGDRLLSVKQTAERLQMSESFVYRELEERRLPKVRLGSAVRVSSRDLDRYVDEHRQLATVGRLAAALRANDTVAEADAGEGRGPAPLGGDSSV